MSRPTGDVRFDGRPRYPEHSAIGKLYAVADAIQAAAPKHEQVRRRLILEAVDMLVAAEQAHVGKVQGDAVRSLAAEWRERAEELNLGDAVGVTHHWKLKDCADELEAAIASALPFSPVEVTDAMVHTYSEAYRKNWDAQGRAPDGSPNLGTFFAVRAGLESALAARHIGAVPTGWKLVPELASEEQLRAVLDTGVYHDGEDSARAVLADEYRTMVAAAPSASPPPSIDLGQYLPHTTPVIDKIQDVMATHGFAVPVRVISDAFQTALNCQRDAEPGEA